MPRPGVMHRDLKPEKFLYAVKSPDARLKAIDFGLSVFFRLGQNARSHKIHCSQ